MFSTSQVIEAGANFLIIYEAHMKILIISKVKILALIKWSSKGLLIMSTVKFIMVIIF